MKVKLLKNVYKSDQQTTLMAGSEYDFDAETGKWLIANDFAEEVKPKPRKTKEKKVNHKTK